MRNFPSSNLIGWFAVAFSNELKLNQKKRGVLADEAYSLARSSDGSLIFNENKNAVMEQNGIIYVWRHSQDLPPTWYIPALNEETWSPFLYHQLKIHSHPQEIYENSIDIAHFSVVHGFSHLKVLEEPHFENHTMSVKHRIYRKRRNVFGIHKLIAANFDLHLYGLGCAQTHIEVPAYSLRVRMFTLTTPLQSGLVEIRLAISFSRHANNFLTKQLFILLQQSIYKNIINDFYQDLPVWENKSYLPKPLLVKGDGQIMKFRRWCGQFYG